MGQFEPNLHLLSALLVRRGIVEIEEDPQGPVNWQKVVHVGTVDLGQAPREKGPSSRAILKSLWEPHEHIVTANRPKRVQVGLLGHDKYSRNQITTSSSDMRSC